MPDIKAFFRTPAPSTFLDCSTLLSLVSHLIYSSSWQIIHDFGISNILGFPTQFRLHTASCNGLSRPTCRDIPERLLATAAFLSYRCMIPQPFLVALTVKSEPLLKLLNSTALLGLTLVFSFIYITLLSLMVSLTG